MDTEAVKFEVDKLSPKTGDMLVFRCAADPAALHLMQETAQEVQKGLHDARIKVFALVLPFGFELADLNAETMEKAGWLPTNAFAEFYDIIKDHRYFANGHPGTLASEVMKRLLREACSSKKE